MGNKQLCIACGNLVEPVTTAIMDGNNVESYEARCPVCDALIEED